MNQPEDKKLLEASDFYQIELMKVTSKPPYEQVAANLDLIRKLYKMGYADGYRQRDGEQMIEKSVSKTKNLIDVFNKAVITVSQYVLAAAMFCLIMYGSVVFIFRAFLWLTKFFTK